MIGDLGWFGPYLVALGYIPGSTLRNDFWQSPETIWDAWDRNQGVSMQDKRLPCCAVVPVPVTGDLTLVSF